MPVHPLIRAYLDASVQELKLPAISVDAARAEFRRKTALLAGNDDLSLRVYDRDIGGRGQPLMTRIYQGANTPGPTLLFFHGGGFVLGDLDTHDWLCRELCNRARCTVVSVDYRLAPEHPYPAAINDAQSAYRWLRTWEGSDNRFVVVGGDSAGAALAASVALQCRAQPDGLRGQLLIYPTLEPPWREFASYREMAEGFGLSLEGLRWFWRQYLQHQSVTPLAAPALAPDHKNLTPALVITAQYDVLRDEGENYAALLKRAGNSVELRRCPGMTHGFLAFSRQLDEAKQALSHCAAWLNNRFNPLLPDSARAISDQNNYIMWEDL